jgi:F-type H+-transporting ATPase subunit epsilon
MVLQVKIIAPDRIVWETTADEVILPTNTGQMGVLTNHTTLLTALEIGVMQVRTNTTWVPVVVMAGFALVENNTLTVIINEAEKADSINLIEAEQQVKAAEIELEKADSKKLQIEATVNVKRARVRALAAQKVA